ncbi:S1C family serine protease [Saccharomonospora iraqiensis]|uniref:S1C family serine protease n=1 Tax=Saccharomonospora iraqiensis TaxID=52698 RepID=UPI00022E0E97|nr:trypsin-like peptidase domain-containing protein [Saccharomonospora iraqiensis]
MRIAPVLGALVVTVALAGGCTGGDGRQPAPGTGTTAPADGGVGGGDGGYADLVEQLEPSMVTVRAGEGVGSGVVLRSDVVVTNQHVVADVEEVELVYADGAASGARVIATDEFTDLAVLRTERKNLPVPEYREQLPRQGDVAIAIGSPLGFQNSVTVGVVSGLNREIPGSAAQGNRSLVDLIQTDASISPGSSGGALLDSRGRVVGINEAYIPPSAGAVSLGFAIPSSTVVDTTEELLRDGVATHAYLGASLGRLTPSIRDRLGIEAERGALVLGVEPGGPAAEAGLRRGDVVVGLGDTRVRDVEDVLSALRRSEPGQQRALEYLRDGQRQRTTVTIGERQG